ncbi:hypothetical protein PF007_g18813 [Phytophthora fragariae]|uniref:Uncharacterized protein n=1 Tax=Phytophthora fragariae TaxID=53985 RepID=A0A6A3SK59_9STRA|nr:hypothetical protein PF007_g18813 [Phytophthora fragariae]KAE9118574.1 hypothetical protein PF006_g18554 [Phytophthora fragariae]
MAIPRKGLIAIGVIVVLAIVGVIVGVVVSKGSSSSSSTGDGTSSSASGSVSSTTSTGSSTGSTKSSSSTKKTTTGSSSSASTITSDPTSATYSLAAFAIGDWGTTTTKGSCCKRSSTYNDYDVNAEDIVANVMNQQAAAAEVAPNTAGTSPTTARKFWEINCSSHVVVQG